MTVQSNIGQVLSGLATWGENALIGAENLLVGIAAKFTGAQVSTLTDAATAYRDAIVANKSPTDAWNAAYAVLGKDESAAFAEAQLGLADSIIELLGTAPPIPGA